MTKLNAPPARKGVRGVFKLTPSGNPSQNERTAAMKIEIGKQRPAHFQESWPGHFDMFSHFDSALGIPSLLCAITTLKANGKPNVCFYSGATFTGNKDAYYTVLPGLYGHTGHNILRDGNFVINFLSSVYYDACMATIENNTEDADEFAAGGFSIEPSAAVASPRIAEAFLCLECKFSKTVEEPRLFIGEVVHAAVDEAYAHGIDGKYGDGGFMINIAGPYDLAQGKGAGDGVAVCKVVRKNP